MSIRVSVAAFSGLIVRVCSPSRGCGGDGSMRIPYCPSSSRKVVVDNAQQRGGRLREVVRDLEDRRNP